MGQFFYKDNTKSICVLNGIHAIHYLLTVNLPGSLFFTLIFTCILQTSFAIPPSADPLPDLGPYACYATIPLPDPEVVTGETTDCGGPVTVSFLSDSPNPGCTGTVIRTYRLADTCGISVDIQQNIFINDNIPPTANPLSSLGTFSCYANIPAPDITLVTGETDNCGGVVTVTHAGDTPNPGCSGTVTRTYLLTDACGNTSSMTQSISIADAVPPVITSCPPDITASCPQSVPPPDPASVTWTDNCGVATVMHMGDESLIDFQSNGIYCTSYLSRLYRVTDACGNFVQCEQIIQIQDICDPGYECPTCEDIVPHFDVDFTDNPDSSWLSPPVVRDGACCAQIGPPPPRCVHFTITLPPTVVAISFNLESGAIPSGSLFYQIDCNEVHQVGDTICLLGDATYELTFCKPGNNENTYSITAFSGNIIPDTIQTQVNCGVDITVEGIVENTAVWNDITGGGIYNDYLSCLNGCLTTTFTPDDNAPPFILYEVCGDRGSLICGLSTIICDTIMAIIYPEVIASINPNPAIFCADNIGPLTGSVTPPGTYNMQWYNGPNGTGTLVGSGPTFTPNVSGNYSLIVTDLSNGFLCGKDTADVQVTIEPLPQFDLGADTSLCTEVSVYFDLPNGPVYTWSPSSGVVQGNDPSIFTVTASATSSYTVTAQTSNGCTWTDTWSINVVDCGIECPQQTHCASGDIIVYQTVNEFISAGGSVSLPCSVAPTGISLVSTNSNGLSCPELISQTYQITDICGNIESCTVIITLDDNAAPVWTSTPTPIGTLSCSEAIPTPEVLTATDDCGYIITAGIDPFTPDYCNGYTITMRWTLTDSCGNNAPDQTLDVNVLPIAPPVFVNPPGDQTITCDEIISLTIPDLVYDNGQTGNCQITGSVSGSINGPVNECGGAFTIEWNYTDTCGRSISHVQTISVTDDASPLITCPADQQFECNGDVPSAFTTYNEFIAGGGSISDNCGLLVSSFSVSETDNGSCPRTITRVYSIADSCGNTGQCIQTIIIDDPIGPILSCPVSLTFECAGEIPPAYNDLNAFINGGGTATDNCGLVESSFQMTESASGLCPGVITRTYSIADSCGNTAQCVQTIIVDDQIAPVINCPADLLLECAGDIPAAPTTLTAFINEGGSVSDNCALMESSFSMNETDNGNCPRTITRTYSIMDSCGNTGLCVQAIIVNDPVTPLITCPADQTLECSGGIPPAPGSFTEFINAGGSASDNCELIESSFSVSETVSGNCPAVIIRTFTIADACGNIGQCVQTISIDDTTPPMITCPSNIVDECSGNIPPAFGTLDDFIAGGGSASDNCALNANSFTVSEASSGICPKTITRTYQISDSCGNTAQCVQTIVLDDTTPPEIVCPPDVSEECSGLILPAFTTMTAFIAGGGSVSDNCALNASTFSVTETDSGLCPRMVNRIYEIADSCGNTSQCVHTMTIDDTTPPVISCPPDINEECSGNVLPGYTTLNDFIAAGGNVSDNCVLDTSSFTMSEVDNGTCPRTIVRTYQIADSCGNTAQCIQTFSIDDPQPPIVTCPPDLSFECVGDISPAFLSLQDFLDNGGNVTDNCGIDPSTFAFNESVSGICPKIISRTFSIADPCGNTGQCVQLITIADPDPPVITCPANLNFECIGDVPPAPGSYNEFISSGGNANDNCGLDESTFSVTESVSGSCPLIITRTYSIADSCGNTAQCIQTISIADPQPPQLTCPADMAVECIGDIPQPFSTYEDFVAGGGSASDNCGIEASTFTMSETTSGICPKTIIRTYTISDSCGNLAQCVQTIIVDDPTPPVIICPGNVNDECSTTIAPAYTSLAEFLANGGSVSDNCGLDELSFSVSESDSGVCPRVVTRTYSIADSCGNVGQCIQTISVDDQVSPVVTCPPELTFECAGEIPPLLVDYVEFIEGGGSASDNCTLDLGSFSATETDNGTCPRIITRTYSIADSCGNTGQCTQIISVDDQVPPVINCPGDLMFECTGDVPPLISTFAGFINSGGSASDNCGLVESSFAVTESDNGLCPRVIIRTYSIADSCGNIAECTQTIMVEDQVDPVITCPADEVLTCAGEIPPPFATFAGFLAGGGNAADNCDLNESTFAVSESDNGLCPRIIIRTYSIADSCGNVGECVQTITVDDNIDPTASNPAPLTIECSGEVPEPDPLLVNDAMDNCSVPTVEFIGDVSDGGTCPEVITRSYSVTDECGNQIIVTQVITVGDAIPPVATAPAPLSVECMGDPPAPDPNSISASDNCSVPVVAFVGDESDGGMCPEIITRTYSVTDECGNQIFVTQQITIGDDVPPVFTNVPENIILVCENEWPIIPDLEYTDNCSPGGTVSGTESGPVGDPPVTTWTWVATDECGNSTTASITITQIEIPVFTNLSDSFCNGDTYVLPDGSSTTTDGSFGPYVFTGNSGCDSIVNLQLTAIDPVVITITDEFCEGDEYILPDGTITNAEGNYGPFEFVSAAGCDSTVFIDLSWINTIYTNINDEFCEGTTYTLPDGSSTTTGGTFGPYLYASQQGCDSIVNLTLVEITQIMVQLTDEFCTGSIYALPDGSTTTTGGSFGPYQFIASNGCDSIVSLTLTEIGPPEPNINEVGPVCISSGIITLIATPPGGSWSGDVTSDQFDPVTAGTGIHQVIYTVSAGGCSNADTINITVYELIISCEALTEESFPGAGDGTASVTVAGGIPPYSINWTGPVTGTEVLDMDGSIIISSLTAGTYTVTVEDGAGCIATCQFVITADIPCELTIEEIIPVNATCAGINNGSITIIASGNMPPFEFSIDGTIYQASNVFNFLAPGSYTVYVKDVTGCIRTENIMIDVGEGPALSIIEIVNATCGVNNGSIEVSVNGGSAPYLYSIDGSSYGLSSLFPGLTAGNYTLYVVDEAGCTDTIPATVESSDAPMIISIDVVDASCGLFDGTITIQAGGGLGALMYSINNGLIFQVSPVFSGLSSGTYSIVVKDEADCQVNGTATIQESGGPAINAVTSTPTGCGLTDGTITITATGVPVLQYSINGTQFQSNGSFQGLASGNYTVTVRDGNGCLANDQVTVNTTDGPMIQNIQHTDTKCGQDDGTITIIASGGTGTLEYILNGSNYGEVNLIEDLPAGTYVIEVVDENGCSAPGLVTIDPSDSPDFDVYVTPSHCGKADGIIELDGVGGTPPYTYSINGGPFSANFTFVNKPSEYYTMAIKDAKGCIYEEEVFLWEIEGPKIDDVVITDPDCGLSNGVIQIIATGTDLQYSITTPVVFQSIPIFDPVAPGTYNIIIKDKFNCRDEATAIVPEKPTPVLTVTTTDSECGMSSGSILANAGDGIAPYLFKLDQGVFGTSNTFNNLPAGNYMITVQGANGCEATSPAIINADGVQHGAVSAAICEGGVYELLGNSYNTPGNYSITLQGGASNGCDSVITLSLVVTPIEQKIIQEILCPGEIYSINGVDYSSAGQFIVDTITGAGACDTVVMLDLMFGDYEIKYVDAAICEGEAFTIGGADYFSQGEFIIDTVPAITGCDSILVLRLEVNALPQANAGADHVLDCDVQTVILEGNAIGGTPVWAGPGIHPGNANELMPEVTQPGLYLLKVVSPENCVHEDVVIVDVDPSTVIAFAGPDAFLSCDIDSVILHAEPVGPDLIYQWTGPGIHAQNEHAVNPVITIPGAYALVVSNTATGCVSLPDTVVVTDIKTDVVAIVQDPNSLDCFSTFIDLNATGSSSGSNLVYVWFNAQGEIIGHTPMLEVTSGGMFTFLVKDTISGCFDRDSVSVTDLIEYPPVDAGDPQQLDCYKEQVVLNEGAQNNLFNIVFQWTGPAGGIISADTLLSIIAGVPGLYYLEAEDTITGCKNLDSVLVTDISSFPLAHIQVVETITCTDSLALLNTGLSTSGPDITYTWSGPGIENVHATVIEPYHAGVFTLNVFNTITGCSSIDTVVLNFPDPLIDLKAAFEIPVCEGDASGSITFTEVTGGVPEYHYAINGYTSQSLPVFENLTAGVYTLTVIDGNGCTYTESITLPDGLELTIDIGIDIELELGDSLILAANVSLPWSQIDSLVWTPSGILSCQYCINPVVYGLEDNTITATVYSGGCFAEDIISLRVDDNVEIYIPNVFSPNGDGVNDHVTVFTDPRVKRVVFLEIFDRWGNKVFVGTDFPPNDPLLGWDGTFRDQPMNPAVFAFRAQVELINGDFAMRKGDITLVR